MHRTLLLAGLLVISLTACGGYRSHDDYESAYLDIARDIDMPSWESLSSIDAEKAYIEKYNLEAICMNDTQLRQIAWRMYDDSDQILNIQANEYDPTGEYGYAKPPLMSYSELHQIALEYPLTELGDYETDKQMRKLLLQMQKANQELLHITQQKYANEVWFQELNSGPRLSDREFDAALDKNFNTALSLNREYTAIALDPDLIFAQSTVNIACNLRDYR